MIDNSMKHFYRVILYYYPQISITNAIEHYYIYLKGCELEDIFVARYYCGTATI